MTDDDATGEHMPDSTDVQIAKLEGKLDRITARMEGRLDQHTSGVAERFAIIERDVSGAQSKASRAHERIDTEMASLREWWSEEAGKLREAVNELRIWRARVVGYTTAMATLASVISGVVVAWISRSIT